VEEILADRKRKNMLEYYIRWVGYKNPTWEHESCLKSCQDLLKDFLAKKKAKEEAKKKRASPKARPTPNVVVALETPGSGGSGSRGGLGFGLMGWRQLSN
jgi:hypothetical protein